MRNSDLPFGCWITILTLAGAAAWFIIFAVALAVGGWPVFVFGGIAILVAPCVLVFLATRSWPQQATWFCFCYSAVPLLVGCLSMVAFSEDERMGVVIWTGAAIVTFGMSWIGMLLGRRAVRHSANWRKEHGLCPKCAYDLRGTPGATACPECGAVVVRYPVNAV